MLTGLLLTSFLSFAESKIVMNVTLSPAGSFQGISQKPKGNLIKQGDTFIADKITVSIESFRTSIDLRDEHLWKHLNATKYPRAILTDLKAKGGKATAMLEVNGIKKPISIVYQEAGNFVAAKFSVKASEFQLKKAEYLGVGVADTIIVDASLPFKSNWSFLVKFP